MKNVSSTKNIVFKLMFLLVIYSGSSTNLVASTAEDQIKKAFSSISSLDKEKRSKAAAFLLRSPKQFRVLLLNKQKSEITSITNSLPQKIDDITTLQSVLMTNEIIIMNYVFHGINKLNFTDDSLKELNSELHGQAISQVCSIPGSAIFLLFGNTIIRSYSDHNGELLAEIRLSWNDCHSR